jgi:hypothetical protein
MKIVTASSEGCPVKLAFEMIAAARVAAIVRMSVSAIFRNLSISSVPRRDLANFAYR